MEPTELFTHSERVFSKCIEVMKKKNADYSSSSTDAFRNFKAVEQFGITNVENGILVRLTDKLMRMSSLLSNEAQVKEETLLDTIEDAINYLVILHAYHYQKPINSSNDTPICQ